MATRIARPFYQVRLTCIMLACLSIVFPGFLPAYQVEAASTIEILVDATDLPRKLLRSELTLELPDTTTSLLYPKWIPGIHGPRGPIQNIGGLVISQLSGDPIAWERDWSDPYRFFVSPTQPGQHLVELTYICSQPSTNSRSIDCFGYPEQGIINWNCVVVYPEGIPITEILVDLTLVLPSGWEFGTALPIKSRQGDTIQFNQMTLEQMIDRPLICGPYFKTVEFATTENARYYLHMAAADPNGMPRHDSLYQPFTRLAHEAEALFGGTHFDEYHLLVVMSDTIPRIGLEHRNSSLNTVPADDFQSDSWLVSQVASVVPHEMAHAWCGKYRRPAGMNTSDYQTDKRLDLLWVYEGLDSYLDDILATRAGFISTEEYMEVLARSMAGLINQKGRQWRPLRDTEISSFILRGGSASWGNLRRSQDYYSEGAMLWMEFDARLRNATDGKKSLDDFCAAFFSHGDGTAAAVSFDQAEIVHRLNDLAEGPWDSLINLRTKSTQEQFGTQAIELCGFRLDYTDQKSDAVKASEKKRKSQSYAESIGIDLSENGTISRIVPGAPAESSGLYDGVQIVAVDDMKFTHERLEQAIRNATTTGEVRLLTVQGESYQEVSIQYDGGLRYRTLKAIDGATDWLNEILAPRTE